MASPEQAPRTLGESPRPHQGCLHPRLLRVLSPSQGEEVRKLDGGWGGPGQSQQKPWPPTSYGALLLARQLTPGSQCLQGHVVTQLYRSGIRLRGAKDRGPECPLGPVTGPHQPGDSATLGASRAPPAVEAPASLHSRGQRWESQASFPGDGPGSAQGSPGDVAYGRQPACAGTGPGREPPGSAAHWGPERSGLGTAAARVHPTVWLQVHSLTPALRHL